MSFNLRRLTILFALVLPASFLMFSCHRDPATRIQKAMERGDREFSAGKYPEAIIYYGQALQVDSNYAQAHYKLAQSQIKMGSFASASRELARTVELDPQNWAAQLELAKLSLRGGKAQDAKDRALVILQNNPKNADAQMVMSSADAALGDSKNALREAQEATVMAPDQPAVFINLGILQARTGDTKGAEASLKKAQTLDSTGVTAMMTLGSFYEQQRHWTPAAEEFQSAITRAPNNPAPRAALASVYMNQGQDALAEKTLVEAKEQLKDNPAAYRMLGDYYLGRGENTKALAEFSALASQHPKDRQVRKTYIQLLVLNHRVDEAASLTDDLLKSNPEDVEGLVLKGEIQLQQGKVDDSIQTLQKALHASSDNAFAHFQLGLALRQKGKPQEGESQLREAVRLSPGLYEAWRALGEIDAQRGDWSGLHNIAVELKKIAPRAPEGYLFDAIARVNQNEAASAEADLEQLVNIAPDKSLGYEKLGQLRVMQKRLKDAETFYRQALSHEPGSIEAIQGLVDVDFRRNKPDEALQLLKATIEQNLNNAQLYILQAQALIQNKQPGDAEKSLDRALQIDKQNVNAMVLLAQLQAGRGARDEAISSYQRAIQIAPNNAALQVALGGLYESAGNWQAAQTAYQKALSIQPDNPQAANNLAYLLLEHNGSVNLALTLAQAARRGLPDSPNTADTLGWAYYHNGAYSVAQPLLEEAVKKASDNAAYRYHLGVTYQKLNDNDRARAQFEKAISLKPGSPIADESRRALEQTSGG
jgi:tetratricopeptide (TPR) repeat protein